MKKNELFTIGFTKKSAEAFFSALTKAGIERVVDIRLNNASQLAGFAKRHDLAYFLREICQAEYSHLPLLAPTKEILDGYRNKIIDWKDYEKQFVSLMAERKVEEVLDKGLFDAPTVLLCSESQPDQCHRRLVAEYLAKKWGDIEIVHL